MKRALFWWFPVGFALLSGAVFACGFYLLLAGDTGTPVGATGEPVVRPVARSSRELRIIILGDSLARGTGDQTGLGIGGRLDQELGRRRIAHRAPVNVAVNGARTPDLLERLQSANVLKLIASSDVVIVSIGGNDLFGTAESRQAPPRDPAAVMESVQERLDRIVKKIRAVNPTGRIYLIGLYDPFTGTPAAPTVSTLVNRWNARLADRYAADPNLFIVQTSDLFAHRDLLSVDHFHPGGEGYGLIARRIADSL